MYYIRMKISKITKKSIISIISIGLVGFFVSCKSTTVEQPAQTETPAIKEAPAPAVETPQKSEEPAPIAEEPTPVIEEQPAEDDEYSRSVGDVQVSRDTFLDDKEKIIQIIKELDTIMKNLDYNSWLGYVEPASIDYWKLRRNLQKAEKRLPVKGIRLNDLNDYFKQVFVPARKGREVSEIRYISDSYIKAVQVRENQGDIVYYYFNKINNKWMIHLPTNEELN